MNDHKFGDSIMPTSSSDEELKATPHRDYLPSERQDMILNILTRQRVATVAELATLLSTSEITVRRDLSTLNDLGLLKRVRGGAISISDPAGAIPSRRPSSIIPSEKTRTGEPGLAHAQGRVAPLSDRPTIAAVFPEPSFFWPGVIEQMRGVAARFGFHLITRESTYESDANDAEIYAQVVTDPTVCGLLAAPNVHPKCSEESWGWIASSPVPVVVLEREQPLLNNCFVDSVRTNHYYGARKAAMHFLQRGHTRIGAAFTETPSSNAIAAGWREIMDESSRITCPFVIEGIQPYDATGVNGIVDHIIDTSVTGVLVHSDYLSISIAQALERRGLRVPEDVSMISIDGFVTPSSRPLTVLRSSMQDLAIQAVQMLVDRIQNPESSTKHLFIDPTLIDRHSVKDRSRETLEDT